MKKSLLNLSVSMLLLLYGEANAQNPNFHWANVNQGQASESMHDVCTDPDGNVLLVGEYQGTIDLDPGIAVLNHTTNGLDDIFIQKLSTEGELIWAKSIGGPGYDYGRAIKTDSEGNIFICGNYKSFMDFDPGVEEFTLFSAGGADAFVMKLNANGDFLWAKSLGNVEGDYAMDMSVSSTGTCYIAGAFYSDTIDLDPGDAVDEHSNNGDMDIFVEELDADGNFVWGKTFGGTQREEVHGIAIDQFNSIYLTGVFELTVDFDPDDEEWNLTSNGAVDVFVEKLDNLGDLLWAVSFGGDNTELSSAIDVDNFGNVYTVGHFFGTVDFDPDIDDEEIVTLSDLGQTDAYVHKLDAAGSLEWVHTYGGLEIDESKDLVVDGQGNVYLTGFYEGIVDFDPSEEELILEDSGEKDIFVQKLNPDGEMLWTNSMGGLSHDEGYAIAIDHLENVYVAGSFLNSADFDPSEEEATFNAAGLDDAFVLKLAQREVSVDEITFDNQLKLYPNPTNETAYIEFEKTEEEVILSISNLLGQELFAKEYRAVAIIPITLEKGVYFIEIQKPNGALVNLKLIRN